MNVARFVGLDSSPRGFTADEASSATHLICIHQTGADANGQRLPLFSLQFEPAIDFAGELPPNNLYFGLLWELIFGHSVNSMRGMSAFLVAMLTLC
jgi:hypothetical protein